MRALLVLAVEIHQVAGEQLEITNPKRVELFWQKVDKDGPIIVSDLGNCWVWTGAKDQKGYSNFTVARGKQAKAHRFSFLLAFGWLLPHPYQVDHKCNNPSCVRPSHLSLLLGKDNNEKSNSASAINKRKTHCKYNHPFDDNNTLRKYGRRICIQCEKDRGRL